MQISKPYDNPFWEKSNIEERREKKKKDQMSSIVDNWFHDSAYKPHMPTNSWATIANSHPKVSFVKERKWFNILEHLKEWGGIFTISDDV